MATIDSKKIIDELIAGNGFLKAHPDEAPDNPPAIRIVEYTNGWGNPAYGVTFRHEDPNNYLRETAYVRNPRIIWERKE